MKILFINNDGGGFANQIEVPEGMSLENFFRTHLPHAKPQDYLIRVNRQPVAAGQVLQLGDRVSCTPTRIEGAT